MTTPIIAVVNRKGGVGKTTVAVHLAASLAARGQNVGIIDTDPQGHVAPSLSLTSSDWLYHASVHHPVMLKKVVENASQDLYAPPNAASGDLFVITGGKQTSAIPHLDGYNSYNFNELCQQFVADYYLDALIIDTAPTYNLFDTAIMFAATHTLFVTEATRLSLDGLGQSIAEITTTNDKLANYRGFDTKCLGIVPNKTSLRTVVQRKQLSDMVTALPDYRIWHPIPQSALWQEASSYGMTVLAYSPDSKESALAHQLATQCLENL